MKTRWIAVALLLLSSAAAALAADEFDARVVPTTRGRWLITVRIPADDGIFTAIADLAKLPGAQTITNTRGDKTYKVTIDVNDLGMGNAVLEVWENNAFVSRTEKEVNRPIRVERGEGETDEYRRLGANSGITPPVVITRVEPEYPADARAARVQGIVVLEAKISDQGEVADVHVVRPLGTASIEQAAMDAVRKWRFRPAMLDGKPVPVTFHLTINFRLPELP